MSCNTRPRLHPENPPGCPPETVPSTGGSSTLVGDPVVRQVWPTPGETDQCSYYHPLFVDVDALCGSNNQFAGAGDYAGEAAVFRDGHGGPWYPPPTCRHESPVPNICIGGLYQTATSWVFYGYWSGVPRTPAPKLLAGVWSSEAAYAAAPTAPDRWYQGQLGRTPVNADGTWALALPTPLYTYAKSDYLVVWLLASDSPSASADYRIALPAAAIAGELYPHGGFRLALVQTDYTRIMSLALHDPEWVVTVHPPLPTEYAAMNRCLMRAVRQHLLDTRGGLDITEFQVHYLANPLRPERITDPMDSQRTAIILRRLPSHCDGECRGVGDYDPALDYRYWLVDQTIAAFYAGLSEHATGPTPWGRTFEWRCHLDYDLLRYPSSRVLARGYDSHETQQDGWLLRIGPSGLLDVLAGPGLFVPGNRSTHDNSALGEDAYKLAWSAFMQPDLPTMTGWVDPWLKSHTGIYENIQVACTPWPDAQKWRLLGNYIVDGVLSPPSDMNKLRELTLSFDVTSDSAAADVATFINEYRRHLAAHEIVFYWSQWMHGFVFNNISPFLPWLPDWTDAVHGKIKYLPSQLVHRHVWAPDLRRMWSPKDVLTLPPLPPPTEWLPPPTEWFLVCPWVVTWVDWQQLYTTLNDDSSWAAAAVQWQTGSATFVKTVANWPEWRRRLGFYPLTWPEPLGWYEADDWLKNAVHQGYDHYNDANPNYEVAPQPSWLDNVLHPPNGPWPHAFIYERNLALAVFEECLYDTPDHNTGLPADPETSVWVHRAGGVNRYSDSTLHVPNLEFGLTAVRQHDALRIYQAAQVDIRWRDLAQREDAILDALTAYMAGQTRCGTFDVAAPPTNNYAAAVDDTVGPTPDHIFDHVYTSWWLKFKDRFPNFAFPPDPATEYWLDYFHSSSEVWDPGRLPPGGSDIGVNNMPLIYIMLRALRHYAVAAGLWT